MCHTLIPNYVMRAKKKLKVASGTAVQCTLLLWDYIIEAEITLKLQNGVSYKYINNNLGTVQISRLVAGKVYKHNFIVILYPFSETPYPSAVISYWLNRRKTEKDY